jgi:hypothetical protein
MVAVGEASYEGREMMDADEAWATEHDDYATIFLPSGMSCRRCSDCVGEAHHWMMDADETCPEGQMICKHCPATRRITEEDFDDL